MELMLQGIFILTAVYLGYKFGKGENIDLIPAKFKAIIRGEAEEKEIIDKLRSK